MKKFVLFRNASEVVHSNTIGELVRVVQAEKEAAEFDRRAYPRYYPSDWEFDPSGYSIYERKEVDWNEILE